MDALRALLSHDADQLTSSGQWRRGEDAAVAGMGRSSAANPGGRSLTVETVRLLGDGTAIADARYHIEGADGGDGRELWSTFMLVRRGDAWKITAIRNMKPTGAP